MAMIFFELSKHLLMSISIGVNCTLAKRILERKHLHSIFNLGYCLYFILSTVVAPLQLAERFNLLSIVAETGQTGALVGSFARKGNKANQTWLGRYHWIMLEKINQNMMILLFKMSQAVIAYPCFDSCLCSYPRSG